MRSRDMPRRLKIQRCPAPRSWLRPNRDGYACSQCVRQVHDLSRLHADDALRVVDSRDAEGRAPCIAFRRDAAGAVALRSGVGSISITVLAGCAPWSEGEDAEPVTPTFEGECVPGDPDGPVACESEFEVAPPEPEAVAVVEAPPPSDGCEGPAPTLSPTGDDIAFDPLDPARKSAKGTDGQPLHTSEIVGYVELFETGKPTVAEIRIERIGENDEEHAVVEVKSNRKGVFHVRDLEAGSYVIYASNDMGEASRMVNLPPDVRARVSFHLDDYLMYAGVMVEDI